MPEALPSKRPLSFGPFELDAAQGELRKRGLKIKLQDQPFQILQILLEHPGQLVTKEDLQKRIWPADTFVDFDKGLYNAIKKLREALGDEAGTPRYIETVPKRGYRFIAPLNVGAQKDDDATPQPGPVLVTSAEPAHERQPAPFRPLYSWKLLAAALVVLALAAAGLWYRHLRLAGKLTEQDTVVLADFTNTTGDPIFDDTLKTALSISLHQSPFLNVLPDGKVAKTLQLMTRPPGTKITPELAREICLRAGGKAYLAGSIASLGREYVLELKAVNCQTGDTLTENQITTSSKENVLDILGQAASKLRGELGESLATVQKFDVPLASATTASLEALQAFSLGRKAAREKGPAAALSYDQRAIQLDPNFAMGYNAAGTDYYDLGDLRRATEYLTKAFALRERASEPEKLAISANYYLDVTGELDKASQSYRESIENYPHERAAYYNLGLVLEEQGQYARAAETTWQGIRAANDSAGPYMNLVNYAVALQRFDEARQMAHEAQARKQDSYIVRSALYALAFIGRDSAAMAEQQQWFTGRPEEFFGIALASDTEAYGGRLSKAQALTRRAVDSALRADLKETGAIWLAIAAQREAADGNSQAARRSATEALQLAPASPSVKSEAALALAQAGDSARAQSLAEDLAKRFPLDTQMQSLWLPALQAQLALNRKRPADALHALQAATPIEFGAIPFIANPSCLYHVYLRGQAYLAAGQGPAAAAEFQKIVDHSGIVWNCWTGALAHLGLARANALEAKSAQPKTPGAHPAPDPNNAAALVRALTAYKDFLTLWQEADPNIPILKQAKAEYARLQ